MSEEHEEHLEELLDEEREESHEHVHSLEREQHERDHDEQRRLHDDAHESLHSRISGVEERMEALASTTVGVVAAVADDVADLSETAAEHGEVLTEHAEELDEHEDALEEVESDVSPEGDHEGHEEHQGEAAPVVVAIPPEAMPADEEPERRAARPRRPIGRVR